ncbi:MAG TPA: MGMT family protein [Actinomycetes bacterium]|nr:MGMT family protein [Actinomycetes bacterium]
MASGFAEGVWALVRTVPPGRVTTYGELAEAVFGVRKGARSVGRAMAGCPADVPWWRVVHADGATAGTEHAREQRSRLQEEGVAFGLDGRVELSAIGGPFSPEQPDRGDPGASPDVPGSR